MTDVMELAREIASGGPLTREAVEARAAHVIGAAFVQMKNALHEIVTNGRWSWGEQCGEWRVSKDVYDIAYNADLIGQEIDRG